MKSAVLFGASNLGKTVFNNLRDDVNVISFCDNAPNKWGKEFCGVPIISPSELISIHRNIAFVIITSSFYNEIEFQLKEMGVNNFYYYVHNPYKIELKSLKRVLNSINNKIPLDGFSMFTNIQFKQEGLNYLIKDYVFVDSIWKPFQISSWDNVWRSNPYKNNTWRMGLHILQPISNLLKAYKSNKDAMYLSKSKEIVYSWIKENIIELRTGVLCCSPWAWNDHSSADRVLILSSLLLEVYKEDKDLALLLVKALKIHGYYLADPRNYSPYNHGMIQDRALLLISIILPSFKRSDEWFNLSTKRLVERITEDISKNGVHLEHSAQYHFFVLSLYIELINLLKDHSIENELIKQEAVLKKMINYLSFIINNDGTLPLSGDTNLVNVNEELDNKVVMAEGSFFCKEAGVAVINNKKDKLIFQSGFHSIVHKHADDCSFTFRKNNIDIFIDCGMFNYQEENRYRKFVRSVFAHNTVSVDGKSYELTTENIGKASLREVKENKDYFYIHGCHSLYPGVQFERKLIYFKHLESIFINDHLSSKEEHSYNQIFNLGEKVEIINIEKQSCSLLVNKEFNVELKQLKSIKKLNIYKGNDYPLRGWYSKQFNQISKTNSIDFEKEGLNSQFWTVINLNNNGIENVQYKNAKWIFEFKDRTMISL